MDVYCIDVMRIVEPDERADRKGMRWTGCCDVEDMSKVIVALPKEARPASFLFLKSHTPFHATPCSAMNKQHGSHETQTASPPPQTSSRPNTTDNSGPSCHPAPRSNTLRRPLLSPPDPPRISAPPETARVRRAQRLFASACRVLAARRGRSSCRDR